MRKLTSFLDVSLDGVVEAPAVLFTEDVVEDLQELIGEITSEQDAVLLGRKTYEEWSAFWPQSDIQPFAPFINNTPKYVVSHTLTRLAWRHSSLLSGELHNDITALKNQAGNAIGVHGSISLVQSLLTAGLLDELKLILFPTLLGQGRRLFSRDGGPLRLTVQSARSMPSGLQYLVLHPRS